MRNKIFRSTSALILTAVLLFSILLSGALFAFFTEQLNTTLDNELRVAAAVMENGGSDLLPDMARANPNLRFTLIAADGTVIYDNFSDPATMENHLERPEVLQALETGAGASDRASDTLRERTIYRTILLSSGEILRIAETQDTVWVLIGKFLPLLLGILAVTFVATSFAARSTTKKIVRPLNALDLEHPAENDVYPELTPLLLRMSEQKKSLEAYILELKRRQTEFSAITGNMSEALLILNVRGEIVFMNRSAETLFHANFEESAGKYLLALDRNLTLCKALERAHMGEAFSETLAMGARKYQLLANPVRENGAITGVVMLFPDITERLRAEDARREFTANVSHELKTPLTVISGYAEIMQNGVAESDKLRAFAGKIHEEAANMLTLVNDILNLSKLDENRVDEAMEMVDLSFACKKVVDRLTKKADTFGVSIALFAGQPATVRAYPHLVGEMVYNLIDNAIQYNRKGGHVTVYVTPKENVVDVSVKDDGIGIPEEYRERVFERFFRVDKSRSLGIPGTGLGLSIVKHAALINHAKVSLASTLGLGTEITLTFPLSVDGAD